MKKAVLAIVLFCGVFAARAWVVTNTFYIVTNEYHYVYYTSVITQQVKNTHAEHYFTNYYYEVTNIQVSTVQNIYRTNFNYNVIWDNFDPWVLAASNSAVNAQSSADSAALAATQAGSSSSSAYSYSRQAAASASSASSAASSGLTAINERVNWFDNHVLEAIANANTLSNMNVIIDAPGAAATYTYLTQQIDQVEAEWNATKSSINERLINYSNQFVNVTNELRVATNKLETLRVDFSELAQYATNIETSVTNLANAVSNDLQVAVTNLTAYTLDAVSNLEVRIDEVAANQIANTAWATGYRITLGVSKIYAWDIYDVDPVQTILSACMSRPAADSTLPVYTLEKATGASCYWDAADWTANHNTNRTFDISIFSVYCPSGSSTVRLGVRFVSSRGEPDREYWLNTLISASDFFGASQVGWTDKSLPLRTTVSDSNTSSYPSLKGSLFVTPASAGSSSAAVAAWANGTRVTLNITKFRSGTSQNKTLYAACLDSPPSTGSPVFSVASAESVATGVSTPASGKLTAIGWAAASSSSNVRLALRADYNDGTIVTNWLNTGVTAANLFKSTEVVRNLSSAALYTTQTGTSTVSGGLSGTLTVSPHGTY